MADAGTVFSARDLTVRFDTPEGEVSAVNGVTFDIAAGETLAVVGESGSGKSQTFLAVMGLLARNGRASGHAFLGGKDLIALSARELDAFRGREIAMVFQDPMTALNPALRISRQLTETLQVHQGCARQEADGRALRMLEMLGIPEPARRFRQYAHELSGGMRQRVMIAMALLCQPRLLIADEPTTALDVTIQAQILDLIRDLRTKVDAAIILITHDLGVIAELAERVAVMYAGRIVEQTDVRRLFAEPKHPYTQGLIGSIPVLGRVVDQLTVIPGAVPNLINLPPGCRFAPRCLARVENDLAICTEEEPELLPTGPGHSVRCWLYHTREEAQRARAGQMS